MSVDIDRLLRDARGDDDEGHEAILQLLSLIERARYPAGADLRDQLGDGHAEYKLTDAELRAAVDGLLDHLHVTGDDTPRMVVHALAKSGDPRVLGPVVDLLTRLLGRTDKEGLANQALQTVIACSGRDHVDLLRRTTRTAADHGTGEVADLARGWLEIHG